MGSARPPAAKRRASSKGRRAPTPHQRAEKELAAHGLAFPETTAGLGLPPSRALYVRTKTFCIFGAKDEPLDALTLIMKLPISAEMAQTLPFVLPSKGWYKQHQWVHAHFGPDDDIFAELETLKGWMRQSYCAIAPKKLGRLVQPDLSP